ncbi:MAG: hypothetical protein U9Q05_13465, partial [Thermodesulfobacteriota bacterium]|nr:hypothetical protein [Thermodesulfobacteriota bacterium]
FGPATALRQWPHTTSMKPLARLVSKPKSGAISGQFIISEALIQTLMIQPIVILRDLLLIAKHQRTQDKYEQRI